MSVITFFFCLIVAVGSVHGAAPKKEKNEIKFYLLRAGNLSVNITNLGARVNSVNFPDRHGKLADIVLGLDSVKDFMADKFNLGSVVGRVANRIGYAQFTLNGTRYKLPANEGRSYFNGGPKGFGYLIWKVKEVKKSATSSHIILTYKSPDGESGFPGDLDVTVKHTVTPKKLITEMEAKTENKATPVNLGFHVVWNLGGHSSGAILQHQLQLFGSKIVEVSNKTNLPTGRLVSVKGTGYDFLKPHIIENNAKKLFDPYSINFVLNKKEGLKLAAIVLEKKSGRILKFWTTAPTLHFCTSTKVKNVRGKGGFLYRPHSGFAFDGQDYPDAVNHPEFPSQIITKGKSFKRKHVHEFSIRP